LHLDHQHDGTNNNDDVASGVTLTDNTYAVFRIDATDSSDVGFYINGTQVATGTTFDMSNYSGNVQPYFYLYKASGAAVDSMDIDYVYIEANRQ
jgi:hypothetical protein